jgi:hypothetical protein
MMKPRITTVRTSIDVAIYSGCQQIGTISARQGRQGFTAHDAAGQSLGRYDTRALAFDAVLEAAGQKALRR